MFSSAIWCQKLFFFFPKESCRHFQRFWRRPKGLFFSRGQTVSIRECGNLNRHLKPNRDAFITTTNCFLCLQPKQSISTSTKTNGKLHHKICQVLTNLWFQQKPTWLYILAIGLHSPPQSFLSSTSWLQSTNSFITKLTNCLLDPTHVRNNQTQNTV